MVARVPSRACRPVGARNVNLDFVRQLRFEPIVQRYDERNSALYALSLGMGEDPLDEDELPFVYEGRGPRAVPSQCVTLCWPPFWNKEPAAQISWRRILHGEESFTLSRPLPAQAAARPSLYRGGRRQGFDAGSGSLHLAGSGRGRKRRTIGQPAVGRIPAGRGRLWRLRRTADPDATDGIGRRTDRGGRLSNFASSGAALQASEPRLHADSRRPRHCARRRLRTPDFAWIEYVRPGVPGCAQAFRAAPSGKTHIDVGSVRGAGLSRRHHSHRTFRDDGRSAFPRARIGATRFGLGTRRKTKRAA